MIIANVTSSVNVQHNKCERLPRRREFKVKVLQLKTLK